MNVLNVPHILTMIKQIRTIFFRFFNLGIQENTTWALANRVQITNSIAMFGILLILLNTISNIIQIDSMGLTLDLIWFIAVSIIPISNYYNKHYLVFVAMILIFTLMTDISLVILGGSTIMTPMYIVAIVMAVFFFERNIERLIGVLFIILNYIIAFFIVGITDIPMPKPSSIDIHIYFIFSVFAISLITIRVLNENKKRLQETERLLKIVNSKNEALEQFAYITSHDLKEPLRNIGSFSGLLERELQDKTNEKTQEYLNFITTNAIQLNGLIESVWDFVEISNIENASFERVDLNRVLVQIRKKLNTQITSSNAQVSIPDLPTITGNFEQLTLLFQHLIENGIKFNTSNIPNIQIKVKKEGRKYIFSIQDNGIGIDEAYFDLIFQPYKTLHNKSVYTGSGVGLAICKRILEQHDGRIWLTSDMKSGSIFYFSLPF